MRDEYDIRRRFVVDSFNKMGLTCFNPEGAFYVFPCIKSTGLSSEEFCEKLLYHKRVAVVPGDAFGECGKGFIRVSYAYSLKHLMEAVKRIQEFLDELKEEQSNG
jgi:aminotransferase